MPVIVNGVSNGDDVAIPVAFAGTYDGRGFVGDRTLSMTVTLTKNHQTYTAQQTSAEGGVWDASQFEPDIPADNGYQLDVTITDGTNPQTLNPAITINIVAGVFNGPPQTDVSAGFDELVEKVLGHSERKPLTNAVKCKCPSKRRRIPTLFSYVVSLLRPDVKAVTAEFMVRKVDGKGCEDARGFEARIDRNHMEATFDFDLRSVVGRTGSMMIHFELWSGTVVKYPWPFLPVGVRNEFEPSVM